MDPSFLIFFLPAPYNSANINLHKLDAAFDIDPLFHKMSKTFDEGGAKGLLLANLGVSDKGCNIVFDSTLDADDENSDQDGEEKEESEEEEKKEDENHGQHTLSGVMVDVSALTSKLETLLGGQTVQQLPLVPQLESLRSDYFQLEEEGFVEKVNPVSVFVI